MIRAKRPARLNLTGLGLNFPRQATLEVLELLGESDIIVNNLNLEGIMEFLALFCRDVRSISFRGEDEKYWADRVFRWLKPGKTVTFLTRGHPLVSGHLARELLNRARDSGVEVRSYSAVSTMDEILCVTHETLSETIMGLQTYDTQLILSGAVALQPGAPALLYLGVPSGEDCADAVEGFVAELCPRLAKLYPKRHQVLLYHPPYGDRRTELVELPRLAARLKELHPRAVSSVVLYLPAATRPLDPARVPGPLRR